MSEARLHLDEYDIEFLTVLCAEEVLRCREERPDIRHLQEMASNRKREKQSLRLIEMFARIIEELDEDDGMEGRPELN